MSITLESPSFDDGATMPGRHSRLGGNVSPALRWSGVPARTIEIALLVEDPDAPSGTFTHWLVAGLGPDRDRIDEGELPAGAVEGRNDFGETGWGGPQPPEGDRPHRYAITLLALSEQTTLAAGMSAAEFHDAVQGSVTGTGQLTGRFGR